MLLWFVSTATLEAFRCHFDSADGCEVLPRTSGKRFARIVPFASVFHPSSVVVYNICFRPKQREQQSRRRSELSVILPCLNEHKRCTCVKKVVAALVNVGIRGESWYLRTPHHLSANGRRA